MLHHYRHLAITLLLCAIGTLSESHPDNATRVTATKDASANLFLPLVRGHHNCPMPHAIAASDGMPSWSSPIAVSPHGDHIWVANPDSGSVTTISAISFEKLSEYPLGGEPWSLVLSSDGRRAYALDRAGGRLITLDTMAGLVCGIVSLGPEPIGLALSPDDSIAYVTLSSAAELVIVDLIRLAVTTRVPLAPQPHAVAVTDDGDTDISDELIYVTHFHAQLREGGEEARDDGRQGQITIVRADTQSVSRVLTLAPDQHGFPNLLAGITLSAERAWVPHVRAAPDLPAGLTTTIFAAVTALDLQKEDEDAAARLLLNDQDIFGSPVNNPLAAVPSPDGAVLYVVLGGSDLVEVIDVSIPSQPRLERFLAVGRNPRGMALSADGRFGYVLNYLSRSVSILDLQRLETISEVPVTSETLAPDILRGKILFNNAVDPRLSQGSWVSCASCHPDGGSDSVTWMFPDGPRQTPPLWQGLDTLPWHWSAALDEGHDVEATVQDIQHGLGLAAGADPTLLGETLAGRSADLDALVAYLASGIRVPMPRQPAVDVTRGRRLFLDAGCHACHGGITWTSSTLPGAPGALDPDGNGMVDDVLQKVGTLNPRDLRGATGFDPPSLLNVGLTPPYFHDGSQPTLHALIAAGHPAPPETGYNLNAGDINALVHFLKSIGPHTTPIPVN